VVFFLSAPPVTSLISGAAGMARNRGRAVASETLPRAADALINDVEAFDNPDAARNPPEKCGGCPALTHSIERSNCGGQQFGRAPRNDNTSLQNQLLESRHAGAFGQCRENYGLL
jgi:hypothetical protein